MFRLKNSKLYLTTIIIGLFTLFDFTQGDSRAITGSVQDSVTNPFDGSNKSSTSRIIISTDFPPTNVVMCGGPAEQCSDPDDYFNSRFRMKKF